MSHNHLRRLLITLSLSGPIAAHAASFNCSRATTPQEKSICADPELSKADEQLAAAYKSALRKVSPPAQADMRSDQSAWLQWLSTVCSARQAQPSATLATCMIGPYRERTETLEKAVVRKSSTLFYTRALYLASPEAPSQENLPGGEFKGFGVLHVEWPQADSLAPPWTAWNTAIRTTVYRFASNDKSATLTPDTANGADTDITTTIQSLSPSRIATILSLDTMGHGAAHPNEISTIFHWLLQQKRALRTSDVFRTDTAWKQTLAQRCWTSLKKQFPDGGLFPGSAHDKALLDVVGDIGNWTITRTGLEIDFPPYSVSPRVAPADPVTIPWSALKAYLVPTFDPSS